MGYGYTEEQVILREAIRDFALKEILPHALEWDEKQGLPLKTLKQLGELGMMGAVVDPVCGGAGLGYPEYIMGVEELSRVDGSLALSVAAHNSLCVNHIDLIGNEEQRDNFLKPLAGGQALGAWALTEPGSGSDAASARTRAVKEKGSWVLNGNKSFCTHRRSADIYVILVVTDPEQASTDFPRSSSRRVQRVWFPGKRRTSWAAAPVNPHPWRWKIFVCRRKTCWAWKGRALRMPCG